MCVCAPNPYLEDYVMSCINLIEIWEDSGQVVRDVEAHSFSFPPAFAIANTWNHSPSACPTCATIECQMLTCQRIGAWPIE